MTTDDTPPDPQRRKEEFRTWFFLTFVMAPVLAVLIVSGYGFLVWIYQMFAGPPTS
jgi:nitrate reductase NapE